MSTVNSSCYLNASGWPGFVLGNWQVFSPNPALLTRLRHEPAARFWLDTYAEFACVIIDRQTGLIQCVRDHFGREALFYNYADGVLAFASNLPDLIASLTKVPALNQRQIDRILLSCCSAEVAYSDETCYHGIYRIEPGCRVEFRSNKIAKVRYWDLSAPATVVLCYSDPQDYLAHFSQLLAEGLRLELAGATQAAVECSGGLDSSAVISGLRQLGVAQHLYMHVALEGGQEVDDSVAARSLVDHYQLPNVQWLSSDGFVFEEVIKELSQLFKGPPNFLFAIGANNIHQAVGKDKQRLLFSGFGGDECVSSHAPLPLCLKEYLRAGQYAVAWHELSTHYQVRNKQLPSSLRRSMSLAKSALSLAANFATTRVFSSLQDYERDLLQGSSSYHLRLRIEDSAIVGKAHGFSYKYPLLYPKLVEFCHRLPMALKRQNGVSRLLIKKYLAQQLPEAIFANQNKKGGIMPAIIDKIRQLEQSGALNGLFAELPFSAQAEYFRNSRLKKYPDSLSHAKLLQSILLLALRCAQK